MSDGEFTLEDFLEQMQAVRKMGPIANILGMLPGAANMKDQLANVDEKQLDRVQAIIRGMTPAERADPKIINGSRRLRIANGSGVGVTDVNQLVERFWDAKKMMTKMAGQFGLPGSAGRGATRKAARNARKGGGKPQRGPKTMPAIAGIAAESSTGAQQRAVGSYDTPGLNQLPPGLAGLSDLPEGFDPSALSFPGAKTGGGGGGSKGNKKKRRK